MAMKPEERPMSLTTPMPWYAEPASTLAASSASCACSTAVSNPKHLSICGRYKTRCPAATADTSAARDTADHGGKISHILLESRLQQRGQIMQ
jgi:hypothetical protein